MTKHTVAIIAVSFSTAAFAETAQPVSAAPTTDSHIVTFQVPGADTTPGDYNGTFPSGINDAGVIVGEYIDFNDVYHGFLRSVDGTFTRFEVPGADTTPGSYNGTVPNAINDLGEITGFYYDASGTAHGFLRSATGQVTTFDPPNSVGTYAIALNLEGAVSGYYIDANAQFHGFVRNADGGFVSIDGPDGCTSGTSAGCYGAAAFNINDHGIVVGAYEDDSGNFVSHGFIRTPGGSLTTFETPVGGTGPYQGTGCPGCALGLNAAGAIAGITTDANNVYHGFLRSPNGQFTIFDAPGAGSGSYQGTGCASDCPTSLNDSGEITGAYIDADNNFHGYLRTVDGAIVTVDPPRTAGTFPVSINAPGAVTGFYIDENGVNRGFLRAPGQ